jgi:predicted DNA binding protein
MDSLRVTIIRNDDYDSFVIPDVDMFLTHLREDSRVAEKYKRMDAEEFRQWVEDGLTPKQFEKLQAINNL